MECGGSPICTFCIVQKLSQYRSFTDQAQRTFHEITFKLHEACVHVSMHMALFYSYKSICKNCQNYALPNLGYMVHSLCKILRGCIK